MEELEVLKKAFTEKWYDTYKSTTTWTTSLAFWNDVLKICQLNVKLGLPTNVIWTNGEPPSILPYCIPYLYNMELYCDK